MYKRQGAFYLDANDACTAWDTCQEGVTCQTTAPSNTVNRNCAAVNVCESYQYMDVLPTLQHLECGVCASHSTCTAAQYESVDETTTSDRECALKECTGCQNGAPATGAACLEADGGHGGTTCASCDAGYYLSGGACALHTDCDALGKVVVSAGTNVADEQCGADKQCTCNNGGTGASGTACPNDGDAKCASCTGAFYLDTTGNTCEAHTDCDALGKVCLLYTSPSPRD